MANRSISQWMSNFQGGARPTLFRIEHNFPEGIGGGDDVAEKISCMVKNAQLPGINTNPIPVFFQGREMSLAGERTFDEITFTIINDSDFAIRKKYEKWANYINGHESNKGVIKPSDYMVDVRIVQTDRDDNDLKAYRLKGSFPTNIAPIELGYDMVDTLEEFTVTLKYQYWIDEETGIS